MSYSIKTFNMIVKRITSWVDGNISFISCKNSSCIVLQGHIVQWIRCFVRKCSEWKNVEVTGSIPTTGKNNKEYWVKLNTCTRSWLTELEQSTPVVQIKSSFRDFVQPTDFDIKDLNNADGYINRSLTVITIIFGNCSRGQPEGFLFNS